MLPSRKTRLERDDQTKAAKLGLGATILVAGITLGGSLATFGLNYMLVERVRNNIAEDTLKLERLKTQVSIASQKTAEAAQSLTSVSLKLDAARFALEQKTATTNETFGKANVRIETTRVVTEQQKLAPDYTKLLNELQPNLGLSCNVRRTSQDTAAVTCDFKNTGVNTFRVTPLSVNVMDTATQKIIPDTVATVEGFADNAILPGNGGSNTYFLGLTPAGRAINRISVKVQVKAVTEQQAINIARRLSRGILLDSELQNSATRTYTQNVIDQ